MPCPLLIKRLLAKTGLANWLPGTQRRLGDVSRVLRHCSDLVLTAPLDDLRQAREQIEMAAPEVIDLSVGAPRGKAAFAASERPSPERHGWPPFGGLPELKAAVAAKLQADNDLTFLAEEEVFITAGALGAIGVVFDAFINPGDRVVLLDPAAPLYPLAVEARRGQVRWVPSWLDGGCTRFAFADLQKAMRGARLLVINSPSNPTGGVLHAGDLEQIAWWADKYDVLVVSDDVYDRFRYDDPARVSIGSLPRARQRTLTVGSVSKSHALASARVGWLAASQPLLLPCFAGAALRAPFVPAICQQLALTALRAASGPADGMIANFASRRRYVYDRLHALDFNVAWPAGAFYFWVPVWQRGEGGREFARRLLQEQQVRVTPGNLFGPSGAGYVRVSYAVEEGRLQEGLNRLAAAIGGGTEGAVRRAA